MPFQVKMTNQWWMDRFDIGGVERVEACGWKVWIRLAFEKCKGERERDKIWLVASLDSPSISNPTDSTRVCTVSVEDNAMRILSFDSPRPLSLSLSLSSANWRSLSSCYRDAKWQSSLMSTVRFACQLLSVYLGRHRHHPAFDFPGIGESLKWKNIIFPTFSISKFFICFFRSSRNACCSTSVLPLLPWYARFCPFTFHPTIFMIVQ